MNTRGMIRFDGLGAIIDFSFWGRAWKPKFGLITFARKDGAVVYRVVMATAYGSMARAGFDFYAAFTPETPLFVKIHRDFIGSLIFDLLDGGTFAAIIERGKIKDVTLMHP